MFIFESILIGMVVVSGIGMCIHYGRKYCTHVPIATAEPLIINV